METEKKYHLWSKKWFSGDPMDRVADKIRKAEDLDSDDLRHWAAYNYLAFPEQERDKIKGFVEKQQWYWRRMSLLIPPVFYIIYAITKYNKASTVKTQASRWSTMPTLIFSVIATFGLAKLGLYSSNKEINTFNRYLYDTYKDEVIKP